ncbi:MULTISPECIES: regulator [Photorhabdus]|uniref:regulator n=1 Tax=Photorhabdus TaxID=29487 RepID=UPI000E59D9CA|nr:MULTISPECIES: regulator [Photorhabdus]MCW7761704.1 regulator [Photorhabdus luminescens subsp. venezuelensis]
MRPNITITITTPYLPLKEYCRIHNMPMSTARDMIRDGRLPIRKKNRANEKVEINMAALTVEALTVCNVSFSLNA